MGIEIDNRMIEAVWRKLPSEVQESCSMDQVVEWLKPMLAIVERDYRLEQYCNAESGVPDVRCKIKRHGSELNHYATLPHGSGMHW